MAGDARFHALLAEIGAVHDKKQRDYGTDSDPFANVRSSQDFGVAPWVGALVRANDKVTRLKNFARKGTLANESAEDSMLDLAVYALISLVLYREEASQTATEVVDLGSLPRPLDWALEEEEVLTTPEVPVISRQVGRRRAKVVQPD